MWKRIAQPEKQRRYVVLATSTHVVDGEERCPCWWEVVVVVWWV